MPTEEVEVTVTPDGKVTVHVKGVEGDACLASTQQLIALLGGQVEEQQLTAEAYIQVDREQEDRVWH